MSVPDDIRRAYSHFVLDSEWLGEHDDDPIICPGYPVRWLMRRYALNHYSDSEVIGALQQLNTCDTEITDDRFFKRWFPCKYDSVRQQIEWCLVGAETPVFPFTDDMISTEMRRLISSSMVRPRVSLQYLMNINPDSSVVPPAGFIFHLSRCGSTLLSNAFAARDDCQVISEAAVLRELLLDAGLSEPEKESLLRVLLQAYRCRRNNALVVKWNAWDICFYPLIRRVFPEVPCLFVIRNPIEILASHRLNAGMHMVSGGLGRKCTFPWQQKPLGYIEYQIEVLRELMQEMLLYGGGDTHVGVVEYRAIKTLIAAGLSREFGLAADSNRVRMMLESTARYSKNPEQRFDGTESKKDNLISESEKSQIEIRLMPPYLKLLEMALLPAGKDAGLE